MVMGEDDDDEIMLCVRFDDSVDDNDCYCTNFTLYFVRYVHCYFFSLFRRHRIKSIEEERLRSVSKRSDLLLMCIGRSGRLCTDYTILIRCTKYFINFKNI
jgi:hypothetical protein